MDAAIRTRSLKPACSTEMLSLRIGYVMLYINLYQPKTRAFIYICSIYIQMVEEVLDENFQLALVPNLVSKQLDLLKA